MDRQEIEKKVLDIVIETLVVDEVTLDQKFEDLNMDSLDRVEMVVDMEMEFGIEMPDDTYEAFTCGRDAVDAVEKHLKQI